MKTQKLIQSLITVGIFVLVISALAGLAGTAYAATSGGFVTPTPAAGTAQANNAYELIGRITNWALGIAGAVAVLFIVYGGFRYITASGNQTQMEAGKNILIKAITGLVIIIVAYVLIQVIVQALVKQ